MGGRGLITQQSKVESMEGPSVVLRVEALEKSFRQHFWSKRRKVLDNVSFHVNRGEIFGFLGPNGAGKSTTIKIVLGIIHADSGRAELLGEPVGSREAKRRIGFLPENPYFYEYLTATEFLRFHGQLNGLSLETLQRRMPEVLEMVGMKGTEEMRLRSFSKGMLQRIGIAQAILHDPDLVILDEPMTGLDPLGRKEVRDLMIKLRAAGKTVFFSTHILADVEAICDRVAIMNLGRLLSCGALRELVPLESQFAEFVWLPEKESFFNWIQARDPGFRQHLGYIHTRLLPRSDEAQKDFERRLSAEVQSGLQAGGMLQSLTHRQANLEDLFVQQVGELRSRV
jgi:ABC-2 type transport system ATP-binding protein